MKSARSCLVYVADPSHPASAQHLNGEHFTFFYYKLFTCFFIKSKELMCNLNKFALELSLERQTISPENPVGHRVSQLSQM